MPRLKHSEEDINNLKALIKEDLNPLIKEDHKPSIKEGLKPLTKEEVEIPVASITLHHVISSKINEVTQLQGMAEMIAGLKLTDNSSQTLQARKQVDLKIAVVTGYKNERKRRMSRTTMTMMMSSKRRWTRKKWKRSNRTTVVKSKSNSITTMKLINMERKVRKKSWKEKNHLINKVLL